MIEEFQILVSGIVQGVGFRSTVTRHAAKHKIRGFVRNMPDGRVEIVAQGSVGALKAFSDDLRQNPGRAIIEGFDVQRVKLSGVYSGFEVR